ncbi:hypothetical protein MHYP_G00139710 [Metynnis hypsauchen]
MSKPKLSSVDIAFLEEYARTMGPVSKALNILQGESDVQMGWLLSTLTLLITKLDKIRITSRYCKPLVDAVQEGLQHRFADMLVEPEFIAAAILAPKFKTSWTCDEDLILRGKSTLIILFYAWTTPRAIWKKTLPTCPQLMAPVNQTMRTSLLASRSLLVKKV